MSVTREVERKKRLQEFHGSVSVHPGLLPEVIVLLSAMFRKWFEDHTLIKPLTAQAKAVEYALRTI
jgi:hypothetical protein